MIYYMYKITNTVNQKIYIGVHQTNNLDDGYFGSGYLLRYAIKKYGKDSFIKENIEFFDTKEEMYNKERDVVNEAFISLSTNYNIRVGGSGGFSSKQARRGRKKTDEIMIQRYGEDWRKITGTKNMKVLEQKMRDMYGENWCKIISVEGRAKGHIAALNPESQQKRTQTMKERDHSKGEKNSQFGTRWIYNPDTRQNKKISKTESIPYGWIAGRILKD